MCVKNVSCHRSHASENQLLEKAYAQYINMNAYTAAVIMWKFVKCPFSLINRNERNICMQCEPECATTPNDNISNEWKATPLQSGCHCETESTIWCYCFDSMQTFPHHRIKSRKLYINNSPVRVFSMYRKFHSKFFEPVKLWFQCDFLSFNLRFTAAALHLDTPKIIRRKMLLWAMQGGTSFYDHF